MTLADNFMGRAPDAVNNEGVKWWMHQSLTNWARRDTPGTGLPLMNATAWTVETASGERSFVVTEGDRYLAAGTALDVVATKIDMLRLVREEKP